MKNRCCRLAGQYTLIMIHKLCAITPLPIVHDDAFVIHRALLDIDAGGDRGATAHVVVAIVVGRDALDDPRGTAVASTPARPRVDRIDASSCAITQAVA